MKFLILIGCFAGGFILIRYAKWLIDSTGIRFDSIENSIGAGATYTVVKLLGLGFICFGFWQLVN